MELTLTSLLKDLCPKLETPAWTIVPSDRAPRAFRARAELFESNNLFYWEADLVSGNVFVSKRSECVLAENRFQFEEAERSRVVAAFNKLYSGSMDTVEIELTVLIDGEAQSARMRAAQAVDSSPSQPRMFGTLRLGDVVPAAAVAGMAYIGHEIRTPLAAISGYAEFLQGSLDETGTGEGARRQSDAVRVIQTNVDYLLELLGNMIDSSRFTDSIEPIERQSVRLESFLREVIDLMKVSVASGVELIFEYDGALPEWISTDPIRLKQILLNLIGNAIKFTAKGSITLAVSRDDETAEQMRIEVCDTGMGMTPGQLERIFQPYQQADVSIARRFGGSGLGLVITRELLRSLGGNIEVESEAGLGTTFRILLPLRPADPVERESIVTDSVSGVGLDGSTRPLAGTQVLLAEDNATSARLMERILEDGGGIVTVCSSGLEVLETIEAASDTFDVILMDMRMPGMDGYETTRRLRGRGFQGRILALTAMTAPGQEERCRAAGCDRYIAKPVSRRSLLAAISDRFKAEKR